MLDFLQTSDVRSVVMGVERLLNSGYIPIVAHIERYSAFYGRMEDVHRISDSGAIIQINASSLFHGLLSATRRQCMKLFSEGLVDVVASDAHGLDSRNPILDRAAEFVISKISYDYAEDVFNRIPRKILKNERI